MNSYQFSLQMVNKVSLYATYLIVARQLFLLINNLVNNATAKAANALSI